MSKGEFLDRAADKVEEELRELTQAMDQLWADLKRATPDQRDGIRARLLDLRAQHKAMGERMERTDWVFLGRRK